MSTERDLWRVVRAMASSETFAAAALVAKPARSEWPEKSPSRRAFELSFLTRFATSRPPIGESRIWRWRLNDRNSGPDEMPAASNHARVARTAQSVLFAT